MIVEILAGFATGLWVGIVYCARERIYDFTEKCRSFKGRDFEIRLNGFESRIVQLETRVKEDEGVIANIAQGILDGSIDKERNE